MTAAPAGTRPGSSPTGADAFWWEFQASVFPPEASAVASTSPTDGRQATTVRSKKKTSDSFRRWLALRDMRCGGWKGFGKSCGSVKKTRPWQPALLPSAPVTLTASASTSAPPASTTASTSSDTDPLLNTHITDMAAAAAVSLKPIVKKTGGGKLSLALKSLSGRERGSAEQ